MPSYFYLIEFTSGLLLTTGVRGFVQSVIGFWFHSPFAPRSGIGESAPLSNVLWGSTNLTAGIVLLWLFTPQDSAAAGGWTLVVLGALIPAVCHPVR
jgi:hypothetical protein